MEKLSIIIPVYNAEPYIKRCLESVAAQTHTNLEVLCVDDGSTDSSREICKQFAEKDTRFKVFQKPNGGESTARNMGLQHATGKYIGFVDNDDWVEPDMYENLYSLVKTHDVTLGAVSFYRDTDTEWAPMKNTRKIPDAPLSAKNMMIYALDRDSYLGFCCYIWNKLFLAETVFENALAFDEEIHLGADVVFFTEAVISGAMTGAYCAKPLYHYYQRNSSTVNKSDISLKRDALVSYKRIEELLTIKGCTDICFWARGFYCYHASVAARVALEQGDKEVFAQMQNEIRNHYDDYVRTNKDAPHKCESMLELLNM